MKFTIIRTLLLGWLWLAAAWGAQAQGSDQLGAVGSALRSGNSRELAQYFAPSVEIGFDGDKQGYNPTQAELVMKNFFAKNAPSTFEFLHQGASNEGIAYAIGRYAGRGGSYRVFVKLKPGRGTPLIDTLDFTKE